MKAHYLPKCYLKGFVDPAPVVPPRTPHLWFRDPATGTWKPKAPDNVAKKPDYYAVTRADGTKDQSRENTLAELEGIVAPILRRLPQAENLNPEEAAALVFFAGTMLLRPPVVHDDVERGVLVPQLAEFVEAKWKRIRQDPAALRTSLEACARETGDHRVLTLGADHFDLRRYQLKLNREFVVDSAFVIAPDILNVLAQMRWRLLRSASRFFITSDRPVHIVDPRADGRARHGLLSPGAMFTLPLTREVLLLGDWEGPPEMSWAGITEAGVRDMNLRRTGPQVCIYSPETDFLGHAELLKLERAER